MSNFFDDEPNFFDDKPATPPEKRGVGSFLADTGLDLAKGVVGLGESVVGLGDIATFGAIGKGLAAIGYDPKRTTDFISGLQSEGRQQSEERRQRRPCRRPETWGPT